METVTKEEALERIKELKKKMLVKSSARLFCCMHVGDKNYVCSMDNLERILINSNLIVSSRIHFL